MNGERYIGVALDYSPSSKYALKWTLENILRPNDHLIVVVVNKEMLLEGGAGVLWEKTGTRKFFAGGLLEIHRLCLADNTAFGTAATSVVPINSSVHGVCLWFVRHDSVGRSGPVAVPKV